MRALCHPVLPANIAELGWIFVELVRIAPSVREAGRCMGPISPRHLLIEGVTLERSKPGRLAAWADALLQQRHEQHGHDPCCKYLGLSAPSMRSVLKRLGRGVDGLALLLDVCDEVEQACASGAVGEWALTPHDVGEWCESLIRARVTPLRLNNHKSRPVETERLSRLR